MSLGRKLVPGIVTVLAMGGLGAYLFDQRAHWIDHYALRPLPVLGIALLVVAALGLRASANQSLFGRLRVRARWGDWFALVTVNSFSNYLPLSAGLVAKAFYLKRVHSMPYTEFAVGQVALFLLVVATNGMVGLAIVLLFGSTGVGWVAAGFAAMCAAGALAFSPASATRFLTRRRFPWNEAAVSAIREAAPRVIPLQLVVLIATAASLQLGFAMGEAQVGFAACVIFSAATVITRLVAITPGGLGVREFLVGGLAVLTGFELRDAVIASTLTSLVELGVIFVLGGAFTYRLSGRVASTYDSGSEPGAEPESR
ncbi:MAG: lysylphosphatidylglycerol synthase domain-containing protein [Myxococcota bacterium]